MITISFYSYKGGVGRSLALTNLGVYLAQFGATVVMVDFDLEAPGLHYKIRPGSPIDVGPTGVANLLAQVSSGVQPSELDLNIGIDVTQHVEPGPVADGDLEQPHGRLILVPAGNPLRQEYWKDIARIDWTQLFAGSQRPGVAAMARLRQHLIDQYNPDVLLIDSRTGITPSGGVSTTLLPDIVVMLLLNTDEHLDGSRTVISAITRSATSAAPALQVVPVLSRYTARDLVRSSVEIRRRNAAAHRLSAEVELAEEDIPLEELWSALVRDLDDSATTQVAKPLVLHADLSLQQREQLSFGPYAQDGARAGGALLDDYLRLFASVVPVDMVSRFVSGIRSRVRAIILDRPDDAVRTLENLTALVGDESVFVDLVKVYVLRRDVRSMLLAADRLYNVHGTIVVHTAISQALRDILVGRNRTPNEPSLRAGFLEEYWRRAAPDDAEWGGGVARALVAKGLTERGDDLCEEILSQTDDPSVLAQLITILAGGDSDAERLAASLALRHFDLGDMSSDFLRAASLACRYQPNAELAQRIIDASSFSTVPGSLAIDVLIAAGHHDEAGTLLVETLSTSDPNDPSVERLSASWISLVARNKALRTDLEQRNPRIVAFLDSLRDETLRSSRDVGRRFR